MSVKLPYSVAVVDDDPGFREAVSWILEHVGYKVRTYPDADAFIDAHEIDALGCVLLDLVLEKENGIDALRRAKLKGHDSPFVMISGYGNIPVAIQAVQSGAFDFIEKPFDNADMISVVARACEFHRRQALRYGRALPALQAYEKMTPRERDVFWRMVDGLATKEIAAAMGISVRTAEVHRARVLGKVSSGNLSLLRDMAYLLSVVRLVNT